MSEAPKSPVLQPVEDLEADLLQPDDPFADLAMPLDEDDLAEVWREHMAAWEDDD